MFFPPPSAWKMVKDAPKKIPENIIDWNHNPREIHKDGYILYPYINS